MKRSRLLFSAAVAGLLAFSANTALAQDTPPAGGVSAGGSVGGSLSGQTAPATAPAPASPPPPTLTPTPPPPAPAPVATTQPTATTDTKEEDEGKTDHDKVVGRFAIGYMGVSQIPLASGLPAAGSTTLARNDLAAPVIGARYWLNRMVGLDFGLGLGLSTGSVESSNGATSASLDKPSRFGMAFHAGVPLGLAHGKHYTFEVIPEANFGFATSTVKPAVGAPPNTPDTDLSGLRFDIGARAGAEVHFGFIGVPQLSLVATVGLYFRHERVKVEQGGASATDSTSTFATSVQSDPWALFVNNISALYYF